MINIHNLPQFVNHTVALVQNKNNNERISLKWGLCNMRIVFEKKCIFFKWFILVKNFFVLRFGLSFQFFFFKNFLDAFILLLAKSCLSLIMT